MSITPRNSICPALLTIFLSLATLAPAAALSVRVTDQASGVALSKATVVLVAEGNVVAAGRTDDNGVWNGPDINGWVVVEKKLYKPTTRRVTTEQHTVSVALTPLQSEDFKRLGRIVGFVKSATGQPLGNATLVILRGSTPVGAAQTRNASGVYELEWYPEGTYSVLATAPGYTKRTYPNQKITAGQALWLEVTLQPR